MPERNHAGPPLFFFNDTATTEIYTLSLHDALPISAAAPPRRPDRLEQHRAGPESCGSCGKGRARATLTKEVNAPPFQTFSQCVIEKLSSVSHLDRKSTRLNSSHT